MSAWKAQAGVQRDPVRIPAPFPSRVTGLITAHPAPTLPHLSDGDSHTRFPGDLNWTNGGQWWVSSGGQFHPAALGGFVLTLK